MAAVKLNGAAKVVSRASASTPTQKQAQIEWVGGVRDLAKGLDQLDQSFKDLARGDKTDAAKLAGTAVKTVISGEKLVKKADAALGLTSS